MWYQGPMLKTMLIGMTFLIFAPVAVLVIRKRDLKSIDKTLMVIYNGVRNHFERIYNVKTPKNKTNY